MTNEPEPKLVIVGAGHAGYAVARAIRARSSSAALTIITADAGDLYAKPTLSVSFSKRAGPADLILRSAAQMREDLRCTLLTDAHATAIRRDERTVVVGEQEVPYTKLVLALGAKPRLPDVPGLVDAERVLCLQDLDAYGRLVQLVPGAGRVGVLGAGFIGCELAADLRRAGLQVALVDRTTRPLAGLVPPAVGARLQQSLESAGIQCVLEARPTFVASSQHGRQVTLELAGRAPLSVDVLVCATGQEPNDQLARLAGLLTARGVVVDSQLRTSDPDIFALGDCARLLPFNLQFIAPIAPAATTLCDALFGRSSTLQLPALAVSVKTPSFPVIGSAGPREEGMNWTIAEDAGGISALSHGKDGALRAFALGGSHVAGRGSYLSQLAPLL